MGHLLEMCCREKWRLDDFSAEKDRLIELHNETQASLCFLVLFKGESHSPYPSKSKGGNFSVRKLRCFIWLKFNVNFLLLERSSSLNTRRYLFSQYYEPECFKLKLAFTPTFNVISRLANYICPSSGVIGRSTPMSVKLTSYHYVR